jgi:hypothetical protein
MGARCALSSTCLRGIPKRWSDSGKASTAKRQQGGGHRALSNRHEGGASSDIGGKASARAATTAKHPSNDSDSGKASANDDNIKQAGQTKAKMSKKHRQAQHWKEQLR